MLGCIARIHEPLARLRHFPRSIADPHRRRADARRKWARRCALRLAVYGVGIGPRVIHGGEVTA